MAVPVAEELHQVSPLTNRPAEGLVGAALLVPLRSAALSSTTHYCPNARCRGPRLLPLEPHHAAPAASRAKVSESTKQHRRYKPIKGPSHTHDRQGWLGP
jgi:hypothetical protein